MTLINHSKNNLIWIISFLIIFTASLFLYYPSLNYYFFQDDWSVLNWVRTGDLKSFFSFHTDVIYWRPLSVPIFFAFNKIFFGLNPFGYHLIVFGIFFLLILCVYQLFVLLVGDRKIALIAPSLYAVWPIHFMSLSWLSTSSYIISPFFQVISFIYFIKYTQNTKKHLLSISFAAFFLALASSELALVLPLIIFGWGYLIKNKNYLKELRPYLAIIAIYLIVRFFIFPIPAKHQYQITINHLIFDNLIWYLGWALNFPESFKDLIDQSRPLQSIKVLIQFWKISLPVILIIVLLIQQILSHSRKKLRLFIFGFSWIILGLLPVIALPSHSYSVYLSFAGLGVLYIISIIFRDSNRIWWVAFVILWVFSSWANLQFTRRTHWIVNEQAISKAYTAYAKKVAPDPQPNSIFLFKEADKGFYTKKENIRQSLGDQDAIKVIYNEPTLKSIFATFKDDPKLPEGMPVIEIRPRIEK